MGQLFVWKSRKLCGILRGTKEEHFVVLFWPYFLSNQSGIWYTIVFWSEFFEYAKRNCVSTLVFFYNLFKKIFFFSSIWELVSRLLIELQSSSKNQKNPHDQLSGVGDTFQSSTYHSFPLKPGRVKNTPSPNKNSVSLSFQFLFELHSFAQSR